MKIYKISGKHEFIFTSAGYLFAFFVLLIVIFQSGIIILSVPLLFVLLMAELELYCRSTVSLTISPEGIKYSSWYYTISTTWDNVVDATRVLSYWDRSTMLLVHLVLKDPAKLDYLFFSGRREPIHDFQRYIPIGLFSFNWRKSELGVDIKKFAPHLFPSNQDKK